MQWLIDIAIEAMKQYLIDNPRFVDRGDPAGFDYTKVNFTTNGQWHDFDLSALVPAGAKAVLLNCQIKANAVERYAQFRKKGNVNSYNISRLYTQTANVYNNQDCITALDENRVIQYRFSSATFTYIYVIVRGWWL